MPNETTDGFLEVCSEIKLTELEIEHHKTMLVMKAENLVLLKQLRDLKHENMKFQGGEA